MKKLLLALLFSVTSMAHADLLLEPYLGYYTGDAKQSPMKEDLSGLGYGARVGFQKLGFMVGLDYMTGKMELDSSPSIDVTPNDFGVFVGYNFPILLRAYGVYYFNAKAKYEAGGGSSTNEGTATKLGVGFTGFPFISINVEYLMASYDEDESGSMNPELEHKVIGLNVSLPLTF